MDEKSKKPTQPSVTHPQKNALTEANETSTGGISKVSALQTSSSPSSKFELDKTQTTHSGVSEEWIDSYHSETNLSEGPYSERASPTPTGLNPLGDVLGFASAVTTGTTSIGYNRDQQGTALTSDSMPSSFSHHHLSHDPHRPLASSIISEHHTASVSPAFDESVTQVGSIPIHCSQGGHQVNRNSYSSTHHHTSSHFVHSSSTENIATHQHQTEFPLVPAGSSKEVDCCQYTLNKDPTPEVIVKHPDQPLIYKQDVGIRYLKPPTPPPSGQIVIREIRAPAVPEAPPLYVRLKPQRPKTPPPLIIREAPPRPPKPLPTVVIDKVLPPAPPPPRKVIVERLPALPPKPQQVIIEKWLPYEKIKRNIVYQRAPDLPPSKKVRNTLITWEPLKAKIFKRFHNLGIMRADPAAYASQHGHTMTDSQSTMNAISSIGASLHYSDAAVADRSGQSVYYDDREELDRLMRTNFHPNDPVCSQFVDKYGASAAYSAVRPCPPIDGREICQEAHEMARAYSDMRQMHHGSAAGMYEQGGVCLDSGGGVGGGMSHEQNMADMTWFSSAYGPVASPHMMGGECHSEVLNMYPQFCHGTQFVPLYNCDPQHNPCPFAMDPTHCSQKCTMCQELLMVSSPHGPNVMMH